MPYLSTDDSVNKFEKGFLTDSDKTIQDPTYLGFKLLFDFSFNSPLFYLGNDHPSAYNYLNSIGRNSAAEQIKKHRDLLENLSKTADHYFQTISGLRDFWSFDIDSDSKWRTAEKKITIEMLEGLDMRVSAIIDLYRKSAYEVDVNFMRELLPENVRKFKCYVLISEFRQFHTIKAIVNSVDNVGGGLKSTKPENNELQSLDNLITTLVFELNGCMWDTSESYDFLSDVSNIDQKQADQKISFTADSVRERHEWQLLDFITDDKASVDRSAGFNKKAFERDGLTQYPASETSNSNKLRDKLQKKLKNEVVSIKEESLSAMNAQKARLEANLKSTIRNIYEQPLQELKSTINKALIGNVYGFLDNPLQAILKSFTGSAPPEVLITNYNNINPNAQQPTPAPFDEFKNAPYLPSGPVDSYNYDDTEVNKDQTKPDGFSTGDVTQLPNGNPDTYDYDSTLVNQDQKQPDGYPEFKIPTNIDQKEPGGYDEYKIPTNLNQSKPNGYDEFKIATNVDGFDNPDGFDEYKISADLPKATNLIKYDEFKDAQELSDVIPSAIYKRPVIDPLNDKIKPIELTGLEPSNKLNPSDFGFDLTPVNQRPDPISDLEDFRDTKVNEQNKKKIDRINPDLSNQ